MNRHWRTLCAAALISTIWIRPDSVLAETVLERQPARAVAAIDGDTFRLEDGREVRLAGIAAAKAVTASAEENPPPIIARAKRALERLIGGRDVELALGGVRLDRHRRLLAHVYRIEPIDPPVWVQGALVREGMARVATTLDSRRLAAEMLALEAEARADGRGIWSLDFYRVLTTAEAADRIDGFHLVEGTVKAAEVVGSRAFLNFGDDWRTDFTVVLRAPARRLFRMAGLDPESFRGRRVRVRGWIEAYNGPMIEATHPEQIEVLEE